MRTTMGSVPARTLWDRRRTRAASTAAAGTATRTASPPPVVRRVAPGVRRPSAKTTSVSASRGRPTDGTRRYRFPKRHLLVTEDIILVVLLPYTPELQPAERLWPLLNEQIAYVAMQTLDELEPRLVERCRQLIEQRELISGLTNFHSWPKAA